MNRNWAENWTNNWSAEDVEVSRQESWVLSETSEGFVEIQRDDDSDVFSDDAHAVAFVVWSAMNGSATHKRALDVVLHPDNVEFYVAYMRTNTKEPRVCPNDTDMLDGNDDGAARRGAPAIQRMGMRP